MSDSTLHGHAARNEQDKGRVESALALVRDALTGLQFGEVLIVIQDGVVVQVERTERKRIRKHER